MKRPASITLVVAIVIGATGCGITGSWAPHEADPPEVAERFKLAAATFTSAGTFTAELNTGPGEGSNTSAGTYTFDDGKLILTTEAGRTLEYDAKVGGWFGDTLVVSREEAGTTVTARMKRK